MLVVVLFALLALNSLVESKFKSIECSVGDPDYIEVELCKLKAINRYRNSASIHFKIKHDVSKATLRLEFFKKANGWKPFLYNVSTNLCDFLGSKKNVVMDIFYAYARPHFAKNYTCPFKANDLVLFDNFELDFDQLRDRFPVETGEYAAHVRFLIRQKTIVTFKFRMEYYNYKEH